MPSFPLDSSSPNASDAANVAGTTTATRYTLIAIVLHWVLAAALVAIFVLGVYMADLPMSILRLKLYNWHKWAGITLLALALVRLLWRVTHRPPPLPLAIQTAMPPWQHAAHHGTHYALYALFFVVPLLGWAYSSAAGFPIVLFGVFPLPDMVSVNRELADTLKPLHKASAIAMAVLVLMHIGAALKHQWIDRDNLLARMLPARP